jgi:hypothetical protein
MRKSKLMHSYYAVNSVDDLSHSKTKRITNLFDQLNNWWKDRIQFFFTRSTIPTPLIRPTYCVKIRSQVSTGHHPKKY